MNYPEDFQLTFIKNEEAKDSIDSYQLLLNIITEIKETNIQIILDNSLPIILGDLQSLKRIFKAFLLQVVDVFKGNRGTLRILFRADLESSFLVFFIRDLDLPEPEKDISCIVDTISNFNLALCKKLLTQKESIFKIQSLIN